MDALQYREMLTDFVSSTLGRELRVVVHDSVETRELKISDRESGKDMSVRITGKDASHLSKNYLDAEGLIAFFGSTKRE